MKQFTPLMLTVLYSCITACIAPKTIIEDAELQPSVRTLRIVFWNAENLFDTLNDPHTRDDEYTPEGARRWNTYRYYLKLKNLAQTLVALGEWEPPAVIGLCEVENRAVVYDLLNSTLLRGAGYQIIHEESADPRGIDPVFIYDPSRFRPFMHRKVELSYGADTGRHILYMAGTASKGDTLHLFMNHWPSKFSGARDTEPKRMRAAQVLRQVCDSLWQRDSLACIIAGGDFNDEPFEKSIREGLGACSPQRWQGNTFLYNMAEGLEGGSHKYRDHWALIDQVFASGAALKRMHRPVQHVAMLPFLLRDDATYMGMKPFRTYTGFSWEGGYSDHMPVYVDVYVK